jgi:hypothetical protein
MTTDTTTSVDRFLDTVCGDHEGPSAWAPGAVLDAVVPNWRFSVNGADAIGRQLRAWFGDPGQLEEVRRHQTASGEIVELTVAWVEEGVPHAARQVHVLDLDADGRIVHDDMWCGGRWPATLLAQMAAAGNAG